MKRSFPLGGFGGRAVCAAGLACALGLGLPGLAAYAEPADQIAQAVPAAAQVEGVDSAQLDELSVAAGRSTARLAAQIENALSRQGLAESFSDHSSGILPVMPYVFGAASALVGVGVFAGAFALLKRLFSQTAKTDSVASQDDAPDSPEAVANPKAPDWDDDTFSFIAVGSAGVESPPLRRPSSASAGDTPSVSPTAPPTSEPAPASSAPSFEQDPFDELESLAMGYVASQGAAKGHPLDDGPDDGPGGGAPHGIAGVGNDRGAAAREAFARTDLTMPMDCVPSAAPSQDFAVTARVLASGSGGVHRVTTPSSHLDFSGIDILDASTVQGDEPAANPMVCREDWQGVALSELRVPREQTPSPQDGPSTAEYVALISTKAQPGLQAKRDDFVAPVIGPGLDPQAAARRQELVRSSTSAAASVLVGRDEEFMARRRGSVRASETLTYEAADLARPAAHPKPAPSSVRRPGPMAAGSPSVRQRLAVDVQSSGVPAASEFVPPRSPASPSVVSDRGLSAAVAAASAAYAAFNSYPTVISAPVQESRDLRVSRAASYASAVYGSVEPPSPSQVSVRTASAQTSYSAAASDAGEVCGAYIDHMVQDEFAHRHDTPAMRNAALGRMQVINGAAVSPVSVREVSRRNRA